MPDRRRAWARALFLAAPDRDARAAYDEALRALSAAIESEPQIHEFLLDPSGSKKAKASLIAASLDPAKGAAGKAEVFGRFCSLIVEKDRSGLLPQIARSYGDMRDADEGIARLEVETAREVDEGALKRISAAWSSYTGAKTTQAVVRINPALIAGYRLRAGSLRIDYSIAGRLERLRRELAQPLEKSAGMAGASGGGARGEG